MSHVCLFNTHSDTFLFVCYSNRRKRSNDRLYMYLYVWKYVHTNVCIYIYIYIYMCIYKNLDVQSINQSNQDLAKRFVIMTLSPKCIGIDKCGPL